MKTKRMTVAQAHKLLGTRSHKELAELLNTSRQAVEYWIERGLPPWRAYYVREIKRRRA